MNRDRREADATPWTPNAERPNPPLPAEMARAENVPIRHEHLDLSTPRLTAQVERPTLRGLPEESQAGSVGGGAVRVGAGGVALFLAFGGAVIL